MCPRRASFCCLQAGKPAARQQRNSGTWSRIRDRPRGAGRHHRGGMGGTPSERRAIVAFINLREGGLAMPGRAAGTGKSALGKGKAECVAIRRTVYTAIRRATRSKHRLQLGRSGCRADGWKRPGRNQSGSVVAGRSGHEQETKTLVSASTGLRASGRNAARWRR